MAEQIALIPELCRATGITNDMRTNFNLMKACADYTRLDPMNYQRRLHTFNKRLKDSPRSAEALNDFNLVLDQHLVEVHGAILPAQKIVFGNSREVEVENSSWDNELRDCRLYNSVLLKRWFVICPKTFETEGRNFIKDLIRVGGGMQFRFFLISAKYLEG